MSEEEHTPEQVEQAQTQMIQHFPMVLEVPCPVCNPGEQGSFAGHIPVGAWGEYIEANGEFPPEEHALRQTECQWAPCGACDTIGRVPTQYGAALLAFYDRYTEEVE